MKSQRERSPRHAGSLTSHQSPDFLLSLLQRAAARINRSLFTKRCSQGRLNAPDLILSCPLGWDLQHIQPGCVTKFPGVKRCFSKHAHTTTQTIDLFGNYICSIQLRQAQGGRTGCTTENGPQNFLLPQKTGVSVLSPRSSPGFQGIETATV